LVFIFSVLSFSFFLHKNNDPIITAIHKQCDNLIPELAAFVVDPPDDAVVPLEPFVVDPLDAVVVEFEPDAVVVEFEPDAVVDPPDAAVVDPPDVAVDVAPHVDPAVYTQFEKDPKRE